MYRNGYWKYSKTKCVSKRGSQENITIILSRPYSNNIKYLSGSIGIARFPFDANTKTLLKKYADIAMYHAKKSGKNRFVFYDDIREI